MKGGGGVKSRILLGCPEAICGSNDARIYSNKYILYTCYFIITTTDRLVPVISVVRTSKAKLHRQFCSIQIIQTSTDFFFWLMFCIV